MSDHFRDRTSFESIPVPDPPRDLMVHVAAVVLGYAEDDDDARMLMDMLFRPVQAMGYLERDRRWRQEERARKALLNFKEF